VADVLRIDATICLGARVMIREAQRTVGEGTTIALIGTAGSGKTTIALTALSPW
jgi:ABC-type glutathione transport system ATPase component